MIRANEKQMALLRKMNKAKARQRVSDMKVPGAPEPSAQVQPGFRPTAKQRPLTSTEQEVSLLLHQG